MTKGIHRRLFPRSAAIWACWAILSSVSTAQEARTRPAYDPVALFRRLDANADGKMSLDEFLQLSKISAKLKDNADKTKQLFSQLNSDRDQYLSLEEFVEIANLGQNPAPATKAEPPATKAKPAKPMAAPQDMPATQEGIAFFEKQIRPVLVKHCYECHSEKAKEIDIEKGRQWWAFQPPKKSPLPEVKDTDWPRSDIDRFLLAALEAKGMSPVVNADRRTLLRRVYFDLIGLPPTPEEVEAFVHSKTNEAFATVVDKLLMSPRFGEHWGRHWLDVARYAESSGKQANMSYPHAWRYRDYVIDSMQADKPFDQFIREQLAGDLLPSKTDQQKAELLIATGFLAIGSKNHNERLPQQFLLDLIDEQIDTTTAFLGMTVSCARCHDHKFDPISTKDYYALSGIFRSTTTCYRTIRTVQSNHPRSLVTLPKDSGVPVPLPPLTDKQRKIIDGQIARYQGAQKRNGDGQVSVASAVVRLQIENLQSRFALYEDDGTPKLLAMGVRDNFRSSDSKLYIRGELDHHVHTTFDASVNHGWIWISRVRRNFVDGGRERKSARAKAASLPGESEAGNLPVHGRRAFAHGHLRLQTPVKQSRRPTATEPASPA